MTVKTLTLINSRRYVRDDNFGECSWWDANCYNHLDGWAIVNVMLNDKNLNCYGTRFYNQ